MPTTEQALEHWRDILARVGVYVFKDAFRTPGVFGFCLYDAEFPVIVLNNSSAKSRQIFTIFHEIAHLLFRTIGIDLEDQGYIEALPPADKAIEIKCNALAADFLIPERDLSEQLNSLPPNRSTAELLASRYKVSREAIYRRMLDRALITSEEYAEAAALWISQQSGDSSGGNYYYNQIAYLGSRYIDLALSRFHQGRFDETRLSEYLNIKPKNLATFEQMYEARQ